VISDPYEACVQPFISPDRLYRRSEVLGSFEDRSIKGVYAWWFKNTPSVVPLDGTRRSGELALLYVGTSKRPLRNRLKEHVRDDASRSTLRRSIGCLLAEQLRLELEVTRVSRMSHCHFGFGSSGEYALSRWLDENARVSWVQHDEPLLLEQYLIKTLTLPINVKGNNHPFARQLDRLLREYEARALSKRATPQSS
jgi:GIY-YIG catalytic domain-containing protein